MNQSMAVRQNILGFVSRGVEDPYGISLLCGIEKRENLAEVSCKLQAHSDLAERPLPDSHASQ
jgi:hypothetical protein